MLYTNELFFLLSALILWGLVIASLSLIKSKEEAKSDTYWFLALIYAAFAFSLFAIASTTYIALITLANTCFIASHLYLAVFTNSLIKPTTRKWKNLCLSALLVFGIVFEILRQKGLFLERVSLVVMLSVLFLMWRLISLLILGIGKSSQLKFLLVTTILEIVFSTARLVLLYVDPPVPNINLYQEPLLGTLCRLCWFASQVISYIAIIAYFIEKISVEKILSLTERNRIITLNKDLQTVNQLLLEKDELLQALSEEKINSEKANQAKSQFLANISHEIRTPLHGLIGLVSMTLKSSLSVETRKSLDKVLYSSKALLLILNDILDFAKIEVGVIEIHRNPFKVQLLLDEIRDLFLIPAVEKGIDLRLEMDSSIPEVVVGDFYKLRQVLFNLVGNSIKFTKQGYVEVLLQIDELKEQSVCLTVIVRDTGIGMSEQDMAIIFEPFRQIDNSNTRSYDGVGLGLPITQNILLKMGSGLVMKSQPGIGTESIFQIRLGINFNLPEAYSKLEEPSQNKASILPAASLSGHRILVAEDNLINTEVIRQYLNYLKIEAHFVTDGQQCLEVLKTNTYDGVLMDIQMPNLDGIQTTYQIRRMANLQNLPIIV